MGDAPLAPAAPAHFWPLAPLGAEARRVAPTDSPVPHARGWSTWDADNGEPWLGRALGMEGTPCMHMYLTDRRREAAHTRLYMQIWTDPSRNHVYACLCEDSVPHNIDGANAPALPAGKLYERHESSAAQRRLFVHYGIGAQNVCAYAGVTHHADVCIADKIPIDVAAVARALDQHNARPARYVLDTHARLPPMRVRADSEFDALSAALLLEMHRYVRERPAALAPDTWAADPITEALLRSTPVAGYSFWHHNCRTFVYWLLSTVLGLDAASVLEKMVHDCKFSMGLPGSMLFPFYEMDAVLGFSMRYEDRIALNIITNDTAAAPAM